MSEHKYPRIEAATANEDLKKKDDKKTSIIFLTIALALFLACVGFLVWNIVRMRKVDTDYVKVLGKVVDVETMGTSSSASSGRSYFLVISYTFDGQEYKFIDREGYKWHDEAYDCVGKYADILVDPQNPAHAERPTSSGFISTFCACCFAFFCIIYAAGMNIFLARKGSSFTKRFLFIWGAEILLGVTIVLLFWTGMPHARFGEVFARNSGAIGVTVVCGLPLLATLVDGIITLKLRPYKSNHRVYRISKRTLKREIADRVRDHENRRS